MGTGYAQRCKLHIAQRTAKGWAQQIAHLQQAAMSPLCLHASAAQHVQLAQAGMGEAATGC